MAKRDCDVCKFEADCASKNSRFGADYKPCYRFRYSRPVVTKASIAQALADYGIDKRGKLLNA